LPRSGNFGCRSGKTVLIDRRPSAVDGCATQGLTSQSSKLTVEIEVRPHVTVQTDISQTTGTGIGLNYKYDY
jgi:hypothetical protein